MLEPNLKAECAVVKPNDEEGEGPSGLAESSRSLERKPTTPTRVLPAGRIGPTQPLRAAEPNNSLEAYTGRFQLFLIPPLPLFP